MRKAALRVARSALPNTSREPATEPRVTRMQQGGSEASGEFDETMLEALEDYVKRQKKRLDKGTKEAAN